MKILFLDQSGKLGGAEICLADVAKPYREKCLVGLFEDGSFRHYLEQQQIPVLVLKTKPIQVRKESNLIRGVTSLGSIVPLIIKVTHLARKYDLIYANTQKALVVGALASFFSRRPLLYHLHDILCDDHFSKTNRFLAVGLANYYASLVIANSCATQQAFYQAGGRANLSRVIYNGFELEKYQTKLNHLKVLKQKWGLTNKFIVGHFSRISPWKGQHLLIEALQHCPEHVTAIFVGEALFGEHAYVEQLHQQVAQLGLQQRVQFLGFRSDIPKIMGICDLIAHTSTAPEPFGRVVVEAMLCGKPVVAAAAGGVIELIEHGKTGWLVKPGDVIELANTINSCAQNWASSQTIAQTANRQASMRFHLSVTNRQISQLLNKLIN